MPIAVVISLTFLWGCASGYFGRLERPKELPPEVAQDMKNKFEIRDIDVTPSPTPSAEMTVEGQKAASKALKKEKEAKAAEKKKKKKSETFEYVDRRSSINPIWVGEKVTLEMRYLGLPAGDINIEVLPFKVINNRKVYHIHGSAMSSSALNLIYRLNDTLDSFFDYEGLFSHRFEMNLDESKQSRQTIELIDSEKKQSFYWNRHNHKTKGYSESKEFVPIDAFSQDSLSSLFFVRNQKLTPGQVITFPVVAQNRTWQAQITVVRREEINTEIGKLKTIVLKPEMKFNGVIEKKGDSFLWLTDDDRRFLVKMEAQVKIGSVVGKLKAIEPGIHP